MSKELLKYFGLGLVFTLMQVALLQHLTIYEVYADLIFIFLVWSTLKLERSEVLILAATLGFLQDALTDVWGLNLFSKVIFFYMGYRLIHRLKDNILTNGQIFLVILICVALYEVLFFSVAGISERFSTHNHYFSMIVVGTFYTGSVGIIAHLLNKGSR